MEWRRLQHSFEFLAYTASLHHPRGLFHGGRILGVVFLEQEDGSSHSPPSLSVFLGDRDFRLEMGRKMRDS